MTKKPKAVSKAAKKSRNGQPAKKRISRKRLLELYPSLAEGPTPAQRLEKLIQEARARGVKPMTAEEHEQWIEQHRGIWKDDEEIDEFIAWVHRGRKTGFYD